MHSCVLLLSDVELLLFEGEEEEDKPVENTSKIETSNVCEMMMMTMTMTSDDDCQSLVRLHNRDDPKG